MVSTPLVPRLCLGTHCSRGYASHENREAEPRNSFHSQAEPRNERILPNRANQLAADLLGPGLSVAHDAAARAEDGDAKAVQHRLELYVMAIHPAARPAGAVDPADHFFAFEAVLEVNPQDRFGRPLLALQGLELLGA